MMITFVDCLSSPHIYLKVLFFLDFCEIIFLFSLLSLPTVKFRYSSEFSLASSHFNFYFYIKITLVITYLLMLKSLYALGRTPDFYPRVCTLEAHSLSLNPGSAVIYCLTFGKLLNCTFPIYELILNIIGTC